MQRVTLFRIGSRLAILLLVPVVLYAIPVESVFEGESICLIKRFFGVECWGCGITRAIFSLLYGRFVEAWSYNHLVVVVFPLLLLSWIYNILCCMKELKRLSSLPQKSR